MSLVLVQLFKEVKKDYMKVYLIYSNDDEE